jgi:hypothetical protein
MDLSLGPRHPRLSTYINVAKAQHTTGKLSNKRLRQLYYIRLVTPI